ncbi:cytochrome P450 [Streptomyces sp. NPDC046821]|uniref:cytochrome P450 n=1 Tax=Streptomyces sp. NPDC046821 TaxID=3154702 RepID=UPI0033C40F7B
MRVAPDAWGSAGFTGAAAREPEASCPFAPSGDADVAGADVIGGGGTGAGAAGAGATGGCTPAGLRPAASRATVLPRLEGPLPPSLRSPDIARDPYPLYRTLRTSHPFHYDEAFGAWLISRHEDVRAALGDPRLIAPVQGSAPLEDRTHAAHRALLSPALRGRALAALRAGVERAAFVLARRLADRQEADLVTEFCHWLPAVAAVSALGLPHEDTARVREWCRDGLTHLGGGHGDLDVFLRPHVARRRARPGADLLSVLCTARADGRPLPDETVVGMAGTLLGAGGEATHLALASFLANLLDHPTQLRLVRERPALIPGAWAESLRRDPAVHIVMRRALVPVVTAAGTIPAGADVACLIGSAGRDPVRFAAPDHYEVLRPAPGRLAFGTGRHRCLGIQLARLTAECALHAVLEALPRLRWTPAGRPESEGLTTRGPKTLPVLLG